MITNLNLFFSPALKISLRRVKSLIQLLKNLKPSHPKNHSKICSQFLKLRNAARFKPSLRKCVMLKFTKLLEKPVSTSVMRVLDKRKPQKLHVNKLAKMSECDDSEQGVLVLQVLQPLVFMLWIIEIEVTHKELYINGRCTPAA